MAAEVRPRLRSVPCKEDARHLALPTYRVPLRVADIVRTREGLHLRRRAKLVVVAQDANLNHLRHSAYSYHLL